MSETEKRPATKVVNPDVFPSVSAGTTGPADLKGSLLKFLAVGLTNNLLGYLTFVVLSLWGMSAIGAMSISYALGMFISFTGNRRWTFSHRGRVGSALFRFLAVNLACYGLNATILFVFVNLAGLPQISVQFVATGVVATCTFLLMRRWVFRPNPGRILD